MALGILTPCLNDAAGDEHAARCQDARQLRSDRTDDVGDDIRQHQIIPARQAFGLRIVEDAQHDLDALAQTVYGDVCRSALGGDATIINGIDALGAQFCGGNGEDARSGANVQDAHTRPNTLLKLFQAHARGRMQTRTKGHTGIEREHDFIRLWRVFAPGGPNNQAASDMRNVEVVLPGVGPVFFVDRARLQPANEVCAKARQVPEPLLYVLARLLFLTVERQIGAHMHRLPREDAVLLALVDQLYRLLDHNALGRVAAQQLADRFDRIGMYLNGQL